MTAGNVGHATAEAGRATTWVLIHFVYLTAFYSVGLSSIRKLCRDRMNLSCFALLKMLCCHRRRHERS